MNELEQEWTKLSKENFIYTKHNYINVYNYQDIKDKILNNAIDKYCEEEGLFYDDYLDLISKSDINDKKIIQNEIDLIMKNDELYKITSSQLHSVNKYKSKAFEIIIKEILNQIGNKLNSENSFEKIFDIIGEELQINKEKYLEFKENITILPVQTHSHLFNDVFNNKGKFKFFFSFPNQDITFKGVLSPKHSPIDKAFFNDDSTEYYFGISKDAPIFRLSRNKNIIFYELDNKIMYSIVSTFDEIAKEYYLNNNKQIKIFKEYYIKATPKNFYRYFYIKSKFFDAIEKINKSHSQFKIKPLLKEYNYKQRPDLWEFKNGKLIFFEVKFNEFTDFNISNVYNTVSYVKKFNKICDLEGLNLNITDINIVHINDSVGKDIRDEIKIIEKTGFKINLINLKTLITDYELEIPHIIKIYKNKNKTERELLFMPQSQNIVIDLTEVTNETEN